MTLVISQFEIALISGRSAASAHLTDLFFLNGRSNRNPVGFSHKTRGVLRPASGVGAVQFDPAPGHPFYAH
jgi:hypothetical protein